MTESETDCIVVGAGSSGSVLASYLALNTSFRTLLIEAGPDYFGRQLPQELLDGRTPAIGSHDWGLEVANPSGETSWLPRGRVVGGCSSINTCVALRPEPGDFDSWPSSAIEWKWESVLQAFQSIEAGHDLSSRDSIGKIPIQRRGQSDMTEVSSAFIVACTQLGFKAIDDLNEPYTTGVGAVPLNVDSRLQRVSTATAYLDPARHRPNLRVMAETLVTSIEFDRNRAVGVRIVDADGVRVLRARKIVLAAGTVGSPSILLRSGVGPAAELREVGVDVVADLALVGKGLADHSQVPLVFDAPGADVEIPCAEALLRYSATDRNDMQLCLLNHVDFEGYAPSLRSSGSARHAAAISANLMLPTSRGAVKLIDRDPTVATLITMDRVETLEDRLRLRDGVRLAMELANDSGLRDLLGPPCRLSGLDLRLDRDVDEYVSRLVQTAHHPTGTAAMGLGPNDGVVDSAGRVFGVDGLWVADASIIPTPIRANTNLTCAMLGYRIGQQLMHTMEDSWGR